MQGVALSSYELSGLEPATEYCWRVRYRDRGLEWSEWSQPLELMTPGQGG